MHMRNSISEFFDILKCVHTMGLYEPVSRIGYSFLEKKDYILEWMVVLKRDNMMQNQTYPPGQR